MIDDDLKRWFRRYEKAKSNRQFVSRTLDQCYEYALPMRARITPSANLSDRRTERLFDSTAPEALQDFASAALDDIWPTDTKPFELQAGPEVPKEQRDEVNRNLAEVSDSLIETINNSNFRSAAHEALLDFGIGTAVLLTEEGDAIDPVRFRAVPLAEALLDVGPFGAHDALFREHEMEAGDISTRFYDAVLPPDLAKKAASTPDEKVWIVEGVERDWKDKSAEVWRYRCATKEKMQVLSEGEYRGDGSRPFAAASYMRVAGEIVGRGPVQIALPDILTLNLVKELILENADLAISGMWQAADDGVVNPNTIVIAPGTIIPKAPGSEGLQPVEFPGNFNISDLIVKDLQMSIRRIMLGDDLGPPVGTPMSATEVMQRTVNRAKRMSGPNARLLHEFMYVVVRNVAYIRRKQGAIKLPAIDGRLVKIRPLIPLTRAQSQEEVLRHDRYLELLGGRFGPQVLQLVVDQNKYADWLAGRMGIDPNVIRGTLERNQLAKAIAAAAAAAAQAGAMPTAKPLGAQPTTKLQ